MTVRSKMKDSRVLPWSRINTHVVGDAHASACFIGWCAGTKVAAACFIGPPTKQTCDFLRLVSKILRT